MDMVEFLRPHLHGKRFEGAVIPLEFLNDLAALDEMVFEVARWHFLETHPGRKRVPRGFTDGIELKLTRIEDGSSIPVICLTFALIALPGVPSQAQRCFELARESIVSTVGAAEQNKDVTKYLPEKYLAYFDKMGRSLREGESIDFTTPVHTTPARLTKDTRRKLLLASRVGELTDEVLLRGAISEADQDKMSFELQLVGGRKVPGPIPVQHLDTIVEGFAGYRQGARVLIKGVGKFDRQNKLICMESIGDVVLLDPLDIHARVDELRQLQTGWLDGDGQPLASAGLNWFVDSFDSNFPDELPLPYLYPTPEGGVQAEWSHEAVEVSLNIDLISHQAVWHLLDMSIDREDSRVLDLSNTESWKWIVAEVQQLGGQKV